MRWRGLRRVGVVLCIVSLAAILPPTVGAGSIVHVSLKSRSTDAFDFPAGSVCPFEVSGDFFKSDGMELKYPDGVHVLTGDTWIHITNVDTGQTRLLKEAGTLTITPLSADTKSYLTQGTELSVFAPGQLGPGSAGAFLWIVGRSLEVDQTPGPNPDPNFGFTTLSFQVLSGSAENLCETMA
jgi:hypothetical protein